MAEYKNKLRSKKLIKNAFLEILYEKQNINKVTVKEIIEKAEISKSTFYAHYSDIYALIEEYELEIFEVMNNALDEYFKKTNNEDFLPYIQKVLQLVSEKEEIYRIILTGDVASHFIKKLKNLFINRINKDVKFKALSSEQSTRLVEINLIVNSLIYTIIDYFNNSINTSLKQLSITINAYLQALIRE